ncbi:MAG: carcinine hydrolase/isopenicillin-N N-acyltransferase family protein [Eubacteriales bacterium]|nr:carcinine hydrolase/isopenicillin-N N-acyltransferase family protein [Eubacteriales bacterium]
MTKKLIITSFCMMGILLSLTGCSFGKEKNVAIHPQKLADYLYSYDLDSYHKEEMPPADSPLFTMGCSSVRKGNFYGRNLDLGYCETPEFVIWLSASDDRFSSVGICANPGITSNLSEMTEEDFLGMPNITNDGINENGVIVSVNIVDATGVDKMTGTNDGKEKIHGSRVVRYLLDHAKSAEHAVQLLRDRDIVGGFTGYGLHWMIADKENTYVVEIIDGKLVVSENKQFYMTNFYLNYGPKEEKQYLAETCFENLPLLNECPIGVERWCILRDHYDSISTIEDMREVLELVKGTNMYRKDNNPAWYSECSGEKLTIHSKKDDFEKELMNQMGWFETRDRKNPKGDWITWHSSIYDIEEKTIYIYPQEDYTTPYKVSILPE